jgi:hypothetical protein
MPEDKAYFAFTSSCDRTVRSRFNGPKELIIQLVALLRPTPPNPIPNGITSENLFLSCTK